MADWNFDIPDDITESWTIPSAFYTDPAAYEASKDLIFARTWQWAGWHEQVKVPGAVHPLTLLEGCLDEPLVLTRDRDDQLHCLSNVCTHRGNIVCEGAGTANTLRCRYHGRRFGLDGKFQYMPEFDDVKGFPCERDDLPQVPLQTYRNFHFVNLTGHGPNLSEVMAEVERRCGFLPMEQFVHAPEFGREYMVNAHWALYVDNYLEGFHIPYIHPALNATLDYGAYDTELFEGGNLQLGVASNSEHSFDLPAGHPDEGQKIAAYYFWIYPNLMLNFYPWGLSVNMIRPIAYNRTKVNFIPFVWKPELRGEGAGGDLDRVEREDEVVVELVQKGLKSRFYDQGRYAPRRERGVHQYHQMIARSYAT
ncbi:MAG: aromatic ring-hydroxylating dioxygenase subunit alpha [Fimbriimonadaceae bacterium]